MIEYINRSMDDTMMMLDERLFDQEWIQELPADARWLYLYLLAKSSRKTGIIELNMRMINFGAATERKYTKEDVLTMFGNRIQLIPGKEDTAIIVDYVATNWAKNGKPIDTVRNPLLKSVVAELERFGLSIESLNAMANKKINVGGGDGCCDDADDNAVSPVGLTKTEGGVEDEQGRKNTESASGQSGDCPDVGIVRAGRTVPVHNPSRPDGVRRPGGRLTDNDAKTMCDAFWAAYPGPRKTDKKKVYAKLVKILSGSTDPVKMFNVIMNSIERWKRTDTWMKNGGQFICMPMVWLNNKRWSAEVQEVTNATARPNGSANQNHITVADDTVLF